MLSSYSSFKNDIKLFNSEEYFLKFDFSETFNNFMNYYKNIENEEFKKPIFNQTSKFKKIPNNYNKNNKYIKIDRDKENDDLELNKNNWKLNIPIDEKQKISILIKTYLNKISDDTYKKISTEFLNDLLLIDNFNLFEILSSEIINKCLFDVKYRLLYINICVKIWNNNQIHFNLTEINQKNNDFYWNLKNNEKIYGPFKNIDIAKNDILLKINFKKYFINFIQNLYKVKDFSFSNLNEDEIFIKKKKILLLIELISILYIEKYINFDIIILIIIDLLHLNNFQEIIEIEYECLYNLLKFINSKKTSFTDLIDYKNIFENFNKNINLIIINNILPKRSLFFLNEIIIILNNFIDNKQNNLKCIVKSNINILIDKIKNNSPINELLIIYKNDSQVNESIYKIIDLFLSEKKINNLIIKFLIEIKNCELIYNVIEIFVKNIKDTLLDIIDAHTKLIYIIENIKYNHPKKKSFIEILQKINDDDNSDDSYNSNDSDQD
jgi:hypothetical protein